MTDTPHVTLTHTPAPWSAIPSKTHPGTRVVIVGADYPGRGIIAKVNMSRGADAAVNVAMIVAAPALLKALRDILELYVAVADCTDIDSLDPESTAEVIAARVAIEQATHA